MFCLFCWILQKQKNRVVDECIADFQLLFVSLKLIWANIGWIEGKLRNIKTINKNIFGFCKIRAKKPQKIENKNKLKNNHKNVRK